MPLVSAILVNWNTKALLQQCLVSVYGSAGGGIGLEAIVVDNASTDGSVDLLRSTFPQTRVIGNAKNLGFAAANNQGIAAASGDYLLLINTDAIMLPGALHKMVGFLETHQDVGIVGPRLLNSDGTVQSSRRRLPTFSTAFVESTILQRWFPEHPSLKRFYVTDRSEDELHEVEWLMGACLLVRASAARQVGPLDEGYFMYSEEMDWCGQFGAAGWKVIYHPEALVTHLGGQSSDRDVFARHVQFQYSKVRYFGKHHGALTTQLLRGFLLLNYLFQLVEESLKYLLVTRNRPVRRHRISVLARVVGWHLAWVCRLGRLVP